MFIQQRHTDQVLFYVFLAVVAILFGLIVVQFVASLSGITYVNYSRPLTVQTAVLHEARVWDAKTTFWRDWQTQQTLQAHTGHIWDAKTAFWRDWQTQQTLQAHTGHVWDAKTTFWRDWQTQQTLQAHTGHVWDAKTAFWRVWQARHGMNS